MELFHQECNTKLDMEIKSTEFFRNIKKIPVEGTKEYQQLIDWEIEKISGGVTVNGVFFSGWLYWHLNHWWIRVDDVDSYGNDIRKSSLPELRDNEWIRAEILEQCKNCLLYTSDAADE